MTMVNSGLKGLMNRYYFSIAIKRHSVQLDLMSSPPPPLSPSLTHFPPPLSSPSFFFLFIELPTERLAFLANCVRLQV